MGDERDERGELVPANAHPSSRELLAALQEPDRAALTLEHVAECLACRIRLSRIRRASDLAPADADSIQRIVEASTLLPEVIGDLVSGSRDEEPQPNEIWRVGRREALLVWVRRVFEDGVADVIPLVLDAELADQQSIIVGANATPLATETAAMVSLRTHLHTGAFINRVGTLDIRKDVTEVITATLEGRRPSGVRVGPPIDDDGDQRLEYRQALRDLLAELSPSAWIGIGEDPQMGKPAANRTWNETAAIRAELGERLPGIQCHYVAEHTVPVGAGVRASCVLKVSYLNTTVLVVTLAGEHRSAFPDINTVAAVSRDMTLIHNDAHAVAIAIPGEDWQALLLTTASMRNAVQVPDGGHAGPTATLKGHGLVDTLCKYLEGAMPAWELTEPASDRIGTTDVHAIAKRHANASIAQITTEGKRARQDAKQTAWTSLSDEIAEQVAAFVVAIVNKVAVDEAFAELSLETNDD